MADFKTVFELVEGDSAFIDHVVTEAHLPLFAAATGDVNPIHFDIPYAEGTFFRGRIAHGMLCGGFISAVVANRLPGLGTVYVSQEIRFLAPVKIGDTIRAEVVVLGIDRDKNRVRLGTKCTNQAGTVVVEGEAVVSPAKKPPPADVADAMGERALSLDARLAAAVSAFETAFNAKC